MKTTIINTSSNLRGTRDEKYIIGRKVKEKDEGEATKPRQHGPK